MKYYKIIVLFSIFLLNDTITCVPGNWTSNTSRGHHREIPLASEIISIHHFSSPVDLGDILNHQLAEQIAASIIPPVNSSRKFINIRINDKDYFIKLSNRETENN
ncbi:MAG: hypothetical protein Q8Q60_00325 [Candidatus Chromulinivorax sp.]|nr:hypothetical protein [Candidatus Chromulinivorax sp.]